MIYQLNRPFQVNPVYFDLEDVSLAERLIPWFGTAWQPVSASLRESAQPLLKLPADVPNPMGLIQDFIYEHTVVREPYFVFHGGAVTNGEDAYLFLASTTTGKTTLITYLTQMGYAYLNDDCVCMDMNTLQVMPYSAPIHLRRGGLSYLQSVLPPDRLPDTMQIQAPAAVRYVYLPKKRTASAAHLKQIFLLNRTEDPSVPDSCQPLPASQTMYRLFTSALIPYAMSGRYIRFFQKLTPLCRLLTYHDAPYAAALLPKVNAHE